MLNNLIMDNYITICYTLAISGMTFCLILSYRRMINDTRVRQLEIDTTRVDEGLPTDMTLTPEDFLANPELAEIFGVTDDNTNLDLMLESNEHFEEVQNQIATNNNDNLPTSYDIFDFDYLDSLYDYYEIMFYNIMNYDYIMTILNVI